MITTPIHYIGKFIKTTGFKGELVLKLEVEVNESFENTEVLFVKIEGLPVPFFASEDGIWLKEEQIAIVKLDDIDDELSAKKLISKEVSVSNFIKEEKPKLNKANALKNFKVIDKQHGEIGLFDKIIEIPGNPLMQIFKGNIEILLPFSEQFIKKTDHKNKTIEVETPDGLLDIYLNEE